MDRIALRRAQRTLRRPHRLGSIVVALVAAVVVTIALPTVASFTVPLGIAAVALLVAAAWPLGPEGIATSLVREPTLPE